MKRQPFWVLGYAGHATPSVAEVIVRGSGVVGLEAWVAIATYLNRDQATDRMAEEVQTGLWQEVAVVERILTCAVTEGNHGT